MTPQAPHQPDRRRKADALWRWAAVGMFGCLGGAVGVGATAQALRGRLDAAEKAIEELQTVDQKIAALAEKNAVDHSEIKAAVARIEGRLGVKP